VSSTILMAIVLVVMWLVVLVPMFVRRHDDRNETRSMDRFATAMRVLSRRSPGTGGVAGRRRYATTPPLPYADGASPVRTAARARMMRRRRRTLAVLATTALLGLPAALLVTSWLWLAQVPAALLLAGYVGWLRQQVRREEERRDRRSALFGEPATAGLRRRPAARRPRPADTRASAGASEAAAYEDRSWRPVPVPTPTYVTAPVARRRPDSLVELDDDDLSFADLDPLGDAVEHPRAVNE
jgi:hypothetical protein